MKNSKVNLSGKHQRISMMSRHYIRNEIYFSEEINEALLRKVRLHLPNLSDFDLLDDRAVFISPVLLGQPMLECEDLSPSEKVEIIGKYLKIIKEFEGLPIFIQINLIRPENFYLVDGELMHRGVLIIEDYVFDYPLTMHHLRLGISNVLLEFIGKDVSLFNFRVYFRGLPDRDDITTFEDIEEDIKKIYIKDLFIEEAFKPEEVERPKKKFWEEFKHINLKFVIIAGIFLVLLGVGFVSLLGGLRASDQDRVTPLFNIIDRADNVLVVDQSYVPTNMHILEKKWTILKDGVFLKEENTELVNLLLPEEGHYLIRLELKDSKGKWSDPYEEGFTKKYYQKDVDNLDFFQWKNPRFDEEIYSEGNKSLVLENASSVASITNIYLKGSLLVEFKLKNDQMNKINLEVTGYQSGAQVSTKTVSLPIQTKAWNKLSLEMPTEEINELRIRFPDSEGTVWLDEVEISSSGGAIIEEEKSTE